MIYAKLDVCMATHPKFVKAGPAAVGYWAACLAYIREHDLDGNLPMESMGIPLGIGSDVARTLADKLVEVGLFVRKTSGAYELLGYAGKNETKKAVDARKAADRERKRRKRGAVISAQDSERKADGNSDGFPGSGSGYIASLSEGVQGEPEKPPGPVRDDGVFGMSVGAWADGVRATTGEPFSEPSAFAAKDLARVAATHAKGRRGQALLDWFRESATEYTRTVDHTFGGISIRRWEAWLNTPKNGSPSGSRPPSHKELK